MLGLTLGRPVDAVVCWSAGGRAEGGTGMAIRIAEARGIPFARRESMTRDTESVFAQGAVIVPGLRHPGRGGAHPAPHRPGALDDRAAPARAALRLPLLLPVDFVLPKVILYGSHALHNSDRPSYMTSTRSYNGHTTLYWHSPKGVIR